MVRVIAVSGCDATVRAADDRLHYQQQLPRHGLHFPLAEKDPTLLIFKYRMRVVRWLQDRDFRANTATSDGNCFPVAVTRHTGIAPNDVRQRVASYLESNRQTLSPVLNACIGTKLHPSIDHLIAAVATDKCWFDDTALVAFAHAFQRNVIVLHFQSDQSLLDAITDTQLSRYATMYECSDAQHAPLVFSLVTMNNENGHYEPVELLNEMSIEVALGHFTSVTKYIGEQSHDQASFSTAAVPSSFTLPSNRNASAGTKRTLPVAASATAASQSDPTLPFLADDFGAGSLSSTTDSSSKRARSTSSSDAIFSSASSL